jgi:serine/threonine-protein kinase
MCDSGSTSCLDVPTIPGYEISDLLGEGGMGHVYKAREVGVDRVVAIKVMKLDPGTHASAIARFLAESRAIARLDHPNLLRIFGTGEERGLAFAVLEYVEGSDLRSLVRSHGPLPIEQACNFVQQTCRGLEYVHGIGIVHRDIKPANLLLTSSRAIKISDWDLGKRIQDAIRDARVVGGRRGNPDGFTRTGAMLGWLITTSWDGTDEIPHGFTRTGATLGTFAFAAPEQISDPRTVGPHSDIYSLGASFYYLLTASLPLRTTFAGDFLGDLHSHEPEPVERLRPDVPAPVAAIVRKMMAKQVRKRYQSAAEVAAALTTYTQGRTDEGSNKGRRRWWQFW